jgi:drug/metabolite transporter (DMT)-like permease
LGIAGFCLFSGVLWTPAGLVVVERLSRFAPISGAVAAAIPVIFDLSRGEELSRLQIFGIVLALAAVLLVGLDHSARHLDGRLLPQAAAAAGAAFAFFSIALGLTDEASGLWPLVSARAATVPVAFVVLKERPSRQQLLGVGCALAAVLALAL